MSDATITCIHDMNPEWCSICKPKDPVKENAAAWGMAAEGTPPGRGHPSGQTPTLPHGPRTPAKFDGRCPWCQNELVEGEDMVFLRAGAWVCEGCAREHCRAGKCREHGA